MTETVAAPRPEMLPRVEVLAQAYAPLVERWGQVFDAVERAEPEELPVELLDAVAEMETECERVRAEALARLENVRGVAPRIEPKPGAKACRMCGGFDLRADGKCRPCERFSKRRSKQRKRMGLPPLISRKPRQSVCHQCGSEIIAKSTTRMFCAECTREREAARGRRRSAERRAARIGSA